MSEWFHDLPVAWIAVVVLVAIALPLAAIYAIVMRLARGGRGEAMRSVSPGLLPPLGIVFALMVGFLAAGGWSDRGKGRGALWTEASAPRSPVLLRVQLPAGPPSPVRG